VTLCLVLGGDDILIGSLEEQFDDLSHYAAMSAEM
jgi:hypothetical protein